MAGVLVKVEGLAGALDRASVEAAVLGVALAGAELTLHGEGDKCPYKMLVQGKITMIL
ncbi:MAG: hypothetical protein JRC68_08000 [Deltaproteobacteria bacterium]|nr:hypothetical protein [Deltaproteobacteria bacterium]